MLKTLIAIILLTTVAPRTSHAQVGPLNSAEYTGYPDAVLEGSRAGNDFVITRIIFTILPKMIVSLRPDRHQLHIELTDEATTEFASLIASHKGEFISVQSPSGKEIVTAKSEGTIRGRYILSKEFKNKTELQKLYRNLKSKTFNK